MTDFEKLGSFYLGRQHDLSAGETRDELVLYDSKDLTTHAVCVGMTGSGKTGLCLGLLEEAGLDGVPAIAIDPKGDLGNLLLTFPELAPSDFRPWIDPAVATRKGVTPDQLAADTAEMWRSGLAKWGQDGERIRRFRESVDMAIYTPGSSAGLPLTVLKSFDPPPPELLDDTDGFGDRVQSAASGVLALLGIDADPVRSREHILLSNVLSHAWREGRGLDLASLIREIQRPPFDRVGVVDLESFYPADARLALGMKLNNLLASPSFASWLEGEPLDIKRLLYTAEGRPRLSILSIAHLNESERMFFVTILLSEVVAWMRTQPGTGSLRALLYMDEVFGYFPPTANPPSKRPMLTLMKQARAYGLGCILATQNPVDLDYKGLSNAGTWFLGRLQTERDKLRVIEGLEGASAQAGANFDRGKMEATLAALGSRVFLLNNVHETRPVVFHTRWAMSYLRGPLTRDQIADLMRDRKAAQASEESSSTDAAATHEKPATPPADAGPPVLSADIRQGYWPVEVGLPAGTKIEYRPGIAALCRLHFVQARDDVDLWREAVALLTVHGDLPTPVWDSALLFSDAPAVADEPAGGADFAPLPSALAQQKQYVKWQRELEDHLYRSERLELWECEQIDARSDAGESEGDFRIRITQLARERRDAAKETVRRKFEQRIERAERAIAKAEDYLSVQRSQFWTRVAELLLRVVTVVMSVFTGGKSRSRVSASSANQAMRERGEQTRAQQKLDDAIEDLDRLKADQQSELEDIDIDFEPKNLRIKRLEIAPRKADIDVEPVMLVWLPWVETTEGGARPAY